MLWATGPEEDRRGEVRCLYLAASCFLRTPVFIDDDMNWKHHIKTVRTELSKVAAIVYKARRNQDGMCRLYYSLFLPYIIYCSDIRR